MWGEAGMTANKPMIIKQWRAFLMTCLHPHAEANVEYQYDAAHQHGSSRGNDVWPVLSRSAHTWLWVTSMNVQMSQVGRKSSSYDSSGRSHSSNTSGLNFVVMLTLHKSRWDSEWQLVHPHTRQVCIQNPFWGSKPEPVMYFSADWTLFLSLRLNVGAQLHWGMPKLLQSKCIHMTKNFWRYQHRK